VIPTRSATSVAEKDRLPMQLVERLRESGVEVSDPQIIARTGWTTDELSAGIDAAIRRVPISSLRC